MGEAPAEQGEDGSDEDSIEVLPWGSAAPGPQDLWVESGRSDQQQAAVLSIQGGEEGAKEGESGPGWYGDSSSRSQSPHQSFLRQIP